MFVNDTSSYYIKGDPSLFYETTICECLSSLESPYMETLTCKKTFGQFISEIITGNFKKSDVNIIVECGGGYGNLMSDVIPALKPSKVYMVDISKKLLKIQQKTLKKFKNVEFVNYDIFDFLKNFPYHIDIFICNEVIGDLKTVVNLNKKNFNNEYNIDISYLPEIFNLNIGAIELIKYLKNKITLAFISEHSSTYQIPCDYSGLYLKDEKKNLSPKRIQLKGHDEYTVNFRMLEEVAQNMGFKTVKKSFMDFLPLRKDKLINFILTSHSHQTEFHEIVYEFYNHVKEYEYLLMEMNSA